MPLTTKTAISCNEKLAAESVRVDEVAAETEKLPVNTVEAQAAWLELAYIFGPLGFNQHFHKRDYVEILTAKRDGKLDDLKTVPVADPIEKP